MKTFDYTARSEGQGEVTGVVEANSRDEAIRQLRDGGLIVRKISESSDASRALDLRIRTRKTKEKVLAVTCEQFAILLEAGLPITHTIDLIAKQTDDKTLAKLLRDTADDVAAGYSLASSFEKNGAGLPATFVESVRAGEESGSLEAVFRRLSEYYEQTSRAKAKVRSAMVYPSFVVVIAVIVVAIIMVFAVPVFSSTFSGLGQELPVITRGVIAASGFMTSWWWLLVLVIAAIVMGVQLAKRNDEFHLRWSEMGVRLPVIGRINLMNAASEYAGTMSVMLASGLPIVRAVGITARSMSNYYMSRSLENTTVGLEAGKTLASVLAAENTLPDLAVEMSAVGEQTGALEGTLNVVAQYYDNEVETATERAMSILEPAIIVVLAVVVFLLLLSVYLPMFSMYGSIA